MSMPQSWVENCTEKCGDHVKSVWMSITTPLGRAMNTLYRIPFTHPQLLFHFFQCVNYKRDGGGIITGVALCHKKLEVHDVLCKKEGLLL